MTAAAYIAALPTAQQRMESADRWWLWYAWDTDTEWTPEDEAEISRVNYLGVLAEVELGSDEYTPEDLENYRLAAEGEG